LISDGKIVSRKSNATEYGWYDASTLKEPYRIEGKKTDRPGDRRTAWLKLPDVIIYPTGGGVGIGI
jgi:threonine synthase